MAILRSTLVIFLAALTVASCAPNSAPVVFKGDQYYGRNYNYSKQRTHVWVADRSDNDEDNDSTQNETLTRNEKAIRVTSSSVSMVTVKGGDTLYSIARNNGTTVRDLIDTNNLTPPYNLPIGSKLRVPSSKYCTVEKGDTLYSISRKYNVDMSRLVALNNISEPYTITEGQLIKLPLGSKETATQVASSNTTSIKTTTATKLVPVSNPVNKNNKFIWPIKGKIISSFGPKSGGLNNDGINISAHKGDEFKVIEDGVVAYVGDELQGYGNLIIVKHSKGWISAYAHSDSIAVKRGDNVKKGQVIGYVGSTGNVKEPQLYFGLRQGRKAVDPTKYLI